MPAPVRRTVVPAVGLLLAAGLSGCANTPRPTEVGPAGSPAPATPLFPDPSASTGS